MVWDISVLDDGKMPANDVVIKGRWERIITKYSVTFEYDGEVPEGAPLLPTACEYEENETVVLPDLTLDGYELVWDTSVLVDGKMPANDVVIKGSWNKLDNSGGSSDIPDTGDTANTNLWLLLLGMSSLLGIVLFKKRYSA